MARAAARYNSRCSWCPLAGDRGAPTRLRKQLGRGGRDRASRRLVVQLRAPLVERAFLRRPDPPRVPQAPDPLLRRGRARAPERADVWTGRDDGRRPLDVADLVRMPLIHRSEENTSELQSRFG